MLEHIDPTVKQETKFIAACVAVLTALMEAVFLVLGYWDITVLWGGLLGGLTAILNFFLMGLTVQKAVGREAKDASKLMRVSQSLRMLMLVCICALSAAVSVFHLVATVIPLLFPRFGVMIRGIMLKKQG